MTEPAMPMPKLLPDQKPEICQAAARILRERYGGTELEELLHRLTAPFRCKGSHDPALEAAKEVDALEACYFQ